MNRPSTFLEIRARHGQRYRCYLLLAVMTATIASIMSSTIFNMAIPDLAMT